jgi:hypothetical protein
VTIHRVPASGIMASALTPSTFDADEYEFALAKLERLELLDELESLTLRIRDREDFAHNVERRRRCRRVIARRMS